MTRFLLVVLTVAMASGVCRAEDIAGGVPPPVVAPPVPPPPEPGFVSRTKMAVQRTPLRLKGAILGRLIQLGMRMEQVEEIVGGCDFNWPGPAGSASFYVDLGLTVLFRNETSAA